EEGSNTAETNRKSFVNIGRLRYDFGDENYIGALALGRNMTAGHNYAAGFDWKYKFWSNWLFSGEGYITLTKELNDTSLVDTERKFRNSVHTAELDGEKYSGEGIQLKLSHSQKAYYFSLVSTHLSPTFQSYNGEITSSGYSEQEIYNSYRVYPDSSFFDRVDINLKTDIQHYTDGIIKFVSVTPAINLNMKGQTYFYAQYHIIKDEKYNGETFKKTNDAYFELNTKPIKELSFGVYGSVGKYVHRSDTPSIGTGHNLGSYVTLKPTSKLNIGFSYDRARLSDKKTSELFYDGNIYRLSAVYQFSQEAFFRTILQYNSFDKAYRFYPLFSYKLGAFTTFYAGATSNYQDHRNEIGIQNTDQQYFVKLQYLVGL
ncbi:MAG: hypothetical protein KDC90_05260, partial [Ignavibacteriae bacterium]|nr:hypothetical protein [Ignavibacteriota bacterium]